MSRSEPLPETGLTAEDVERLAAAGISLAEAERQLRLLRDPPPPRQLIRPCRLGDGIRSIDPAEQDRLIERFEEAAAAGRVGRMVPASGAASRMFAALAGLLGEDSLPPEPEALRAMAEAGDDGAAATLDLFDRREQLPFWDVLAAAVEPEDRSDLRTVVGALLAPAPRGPGYARQPKGLIPFHRYAAGARTPFEEHLAEAAAHSPRSDSPCSVHFTVGADHEPAFRQLLSRIGPALEAGVGTRFEVTFSCQSPATDTLAVELDGRPFRQADGSLLLRPGGHGALLANLEALAAAGADLVQIKNIDNVVPDRDRPLVTHWQRVLGGLLVSLQAAADDLLARLEPAADPRAVEDAESFIASNLGSPVEARSQAPDERLRSLTERLDRPWRVCGMVENQGEPGGGPFWVRSADGGATPQIVEGAEIDLADPGQRAIRDAATHFNPVDLVCAVRDRHGRPYRLEDFADPDAVFLAEKDHEGRPLRALERPGLWNGAMARWNTVFVEIPAATFAPVKTVFDLLRPAHRA